MENFLPNDYEQPRTGGNYLKFQEGQNRFRIIGNAHLGWEDWQEDNGVKKPVRYQFKGQDSKPAPLNKDRAVKHFWAFPVWDYAENKVKVLEITQSSIQTAINDLFKNQDWGSPLKYDLVVTKTGKDLETKYSVMPSPHKELSDEVKAEIAKTPVDVSKLFTGDDPFDAKLTPAQHMQQAKDEQREIENNVDNIPM